MGGFAPPNESEQAGAASRNARKKAGKDKAASKAEEEKSAKLAAALAPVAAAFSAPVEFSPPSRKAATEDAPAGKEPAPSNESAGGGGMDNPEVEKRVRALQKKLRDINKLKE